MDVIHVWIVVIASVINNYTKNTLLILALLFSIGCAPSFSEFQTADLAGKGTIEVTPYISSTKGEAPSGDTSESVDLQDSKGVRIAYGLNNNYDFHFRYENIEVESGYAEGSVISSGLKFKLSSPFYLSEKHRFSFYLPVSYYTQKLDLGSSLEDYIGKKGEMNYIAVEPTLLGSSKILNKFDINYSGKIIKKISGDDIEEDVIYVFNCSITLPISSAARLMPEYGLCKMGDQSYTYSGIGISIKL